MAYLNQLAKMSAPVGKPPAIKKPNLGAAPIPAAQPHIQPPPYDAAMDPAWKGILDPNNHDLRNLLNSLEPEQRQVLLVNIGRASPSPIGAQPDAMPPSMPSLPPPGP